MTISVCVITYNHESLIADCLQSILDQKTRYPFEIVIGEDGSSDNTRKIIERYRQDFPDKIKPLPDEGNLGMMPNFISTLQHCNGTYIALCEGDDYWSDQYKLQKQVDFLENNPDYSICFTNTEYLNQQTGEKKEVVTSGSRTSNFYELLQRNFIATQTVMYRNLNLEPA